MGLSTMVKASTISCVATGAALISSPAANAQSDCQAWQPEDRAVIVMKAANQDGDAGYVRSLRNGHRLIANFDEVDGRSVFLIINVADDAYALYAPSWDAYVQIDQDLDLRANADEATAALFEFVQADNNEVKIRYAAQNIFIKLAGDKNALRLRAAGARDAQGFCFYNAEVR